MVEKVLRIRLKDLETIRITCLKCNGTFEADAETAGNRLSDSRCPLCRAHWFTPVKDDRNPFRDWWLLFRDLKLMEEGGTARIEFLSKVED